MAKKPSKRDIEFLFEIGTIRFIDRTWRQFLSPKFANLAEHHYRVMWLALMIARHEGVKDTEKVLKMALVHDIPESRAGDVHYVSRLYTERNEALGIADMLDDTIVKDMEQVWQEYEKRQCIEAKVVKDADNLDVDLELKEQEAMGSMGIKDSLRGNRERVFEAMLFTKTAKEIWQAIQKADPHDWHRLGRNRLNTGDWKKAN